MSSNINLLQETADVKANETKWGYSAWRIATKLERLFAFATDSESGRGQTGRGRCPGDFS